MTYLPEDVCEQIVEHFVLQGRTWAHRTRNRSVAARVCDNWKRFTYRLRHLWATVTVHRWMEPAFLSFVLEQLPTGTITLHFDFEYGNAHLYDPGKQRTRSVTVVCHEFLPLLAPVCERLSAFSITGDEPFDWAYTIFSLGRLDRPFPELTSLAYTVRTVGRHGGARNPSILAPAGNLTRMTLSGTLPIWTEPTIYTGLNFLHLHYSIAPVPWLTLKAVLTSASNLETLYLEDVTCPDTPSTGCLTLPRVSHLSLQYRSASNPVLVERLILPANRRLDVIVRDNVQVIFEAESLLRGAANVTLTLPADNLTALDFVLAMLESVKVLDLRACGSRAASAVERLLRTPRTLPHLHTLLLEGTAVSDDATDGLTVAGFTDGALVQLGDGVKAGESGLYLRREIQDV